MEGGVRELVSERKGGGVKERETERGTERRGVSERRRGGGAEREREREAERERHTV